MSTTNDQGERVSELPIGTWHVEPTTSKLEFGSRGMFGLVPVRGHFGEFDGQLTVDDVGARGELRIHARTLDTRNAKRDQHLRSADFFHVETHPIVTFELTGLESAADGATALTGVLRIRDNALRIEAPLEIDVADADRVVLSTKLSVDRAAAGVGWSKLGMIKGKAHLEAAVTLIRMD